MLLYCLISIGEVSSSRVRCECNSPQSTCQHHFKITNFIPCHDYGNKTACWPLTLLEARPGRGKSGPHQLKPQSCRYTTSLPLPDATCCRQNRVLLKFQERLFKVVTPEVEPREGVLIAWKWCLSNHIPASVYKSLEKWFNFSKPQSSQRYVGTFHYSSLKFVLSIKSFLHTHTLIHIHTFVQLHALTSTGPNTNKCILIFFTNYSCFMLLLSSFLYFCVYIAYFDRIYVARPIHCSHLILP